MSRTPQHSRPILCYDPDVFSSRIITWPLLITLAFGNLLLVRTCESLVSVSISLATSSEPGVPDCCRNGICPHHGHLESAPVPLQHDDCKCHLSSDDHSSPTLSLSIPAIMPLSEDAGVARQDSGRAGSPHFQWGSSNQIPPTPPPRA